MKKILVLGGPDARTAESIVLALAERGIQAIVVDGKDLPEDVVLVDEKPMLISEPVSRNNHSGPRRLFIADFALSAAALMAHLDSADHVSFMEKLRESSVRLSLSELTVKLDELPPDFWGDTTPRKAPWRERRKFGFESSSPNLGAPKKIHPTRMSGTVQRGKY